MAEKRDRWKRLKADVEGFEERRAGGREQLLWNAGRVRRALREEARRWRRGDGQDAVRALYGAAADVERGAVPLIGCDGFDGDGRADDVDDGVFGADLVEVDGLGWTIVNLGLSLGEQFEGFEREGLRAGLMGRGR